MLKSKKILVPFDYSDEANQALVFSSNLSKILNADLEVIHISDEVNKDAFEKYLENHKIVVDSSVLIAPVPDLLYEEQITRYATKELTSLIVSGSQGTKKQDRDSTLSAGLIALAPCPVLTIKPNQSLELKNILFSSEFLDSDDHKEFNVVSQLARCFGAKVTFVSVGNEEKKDHVISNIKELILEWEIDSFDIQFLSDMSVVNGIYSTIKSVDPDLVVLGYHPSRIQDHKLYGALSEDFTSHTKFSVLALHL